MLSYYLKCRKNTESRNPKVVRSIYGKIMLSSRCAVRDSKISKLSKEQEARKLN